MLNIKDLHKRAGHFCKCLSLKGLCLVIENVDNRRELPECPIHHSLAKRVGVAGAEEKLALVHRYVRTIGTSLRARARGHYGEAAFGELIRLAEGEDCFHWDRLIESTTNSKHYRTNIARLDMK